MSNHFPEGMPPRSEWSHLRREIPEFVEDVVAAAVRGFKKGSRKDSDPQEAPTDKALVRVGERDVTIPIERAEEQRPDVASGSFRRSPVMLLVVFGVLLLAALVLSLVFNVLGFVFTLLSVIFGFLSGLFKVLAGLRFLSVLAFIPLVAGVVVGILVLMRGRVRRN